MNKNNYNYILNGITHEIPLDSNIKIRIDPINEETLISNKFMIKFISDLFEYNNIDYFLLGDTLLGIKVFSGINLFSNKIQFGIIKNNLIQLKKIEQYLIDNDFYIYYFENFIIINSVFFNDTNTYAIIYLVENDKKLFLKTEKDEFIFFDFYEIFPLQKTKIEEFTIYVPNKIESVLTSSNIYYENITFNKIIECDLNKLLEIKNDNNDSISIDKKYNKKKIIINEELELDKNDIYVNNNQEVLNIDNMINNIINQNNEIEFNNLEEDEISVIEDEKIIEDISIINNKNEYENQYENEIIKKKLYSKEIYISIILVMIIIYDYQI
jgi:hypothetical protein